MLTQSRGAVHIYSLAKEPATNVVAALAPKKSLETELPDKRPPA